jgi:hypothetical protein
MSQPQSLRSRNARYCSSPVDAAPMREDVVISISPLRPRPVLCPTGGRLPEPGGVVGHFMPCYQEVRHTLVRRKSDKGVIMARAESVWNARRLVTFWCVGRAHVTVSTMHVVVAPQWLAPGARSKVEHLRRHGSQRPMRDRSLNVGEPMAQEYPTIAEVFTPDEDPTYTFVSRSDDTSEALMREVAQGARFVVSLSGPSKCGKTVTVRRVFGENLIEITGSNLASAKELWDRVLDWMEVPASTSHSTTGQLGGGGGLNFGIAAVRADVASGDTVTENFERGGLAQVVKEIGGSVFVIFVDDFHYINTDVQRELSKQIKHAFEAVVKIIAASVPHRSEDLLRSNPELRGRLTNIDVRYWNLQDLRRIAELGFEELNLVIPDNIIDRLVDEACGSPQLMQAMCQFLCYEAGVSQRQHEQINFSFDEQRLGGVLDRTTLKCNFSDLLTKLHGGPKTRGTERKVFEFTDGTRGDVYRAVLLGLRGGRPELGIKYAELNNRIEHCCVGERPVGSAVVEACKQMAKMADSVVPGARSLDWDEDYEVLNISDPYLLFYIRCSKRLHALGRQSG